MSLVLSCRSATAQVGISAKDARVYTAGRRREIEFTDAALGMLACATSQDQRSVIVAGASAERAEVAAAVGLNVRVADYRALIGRIDSVLRHSRELDARVRGLDSLRVRLAVLRAQMLSHSITPITTTTKSRRDKCIAK